jgi:hypothetical protein
MKVSRVAVHMTDQIPAGYPAQMNVNLNLIIDHTGYKDDNKLLTSSPM